MSNFPPFRFRSESQQALNRNFTRLSRIALVVGLMVFSSSAPLAFLVSASGVTPPHVLVASALPEVHQHSDDIQSNPKKGDSVDSFIIEMVNGVSTCRRASPAEIPSTLPRPGEVGIQVRELLKSSSPSRASISGGENSSTGLTINLLALSQLQTDSNRATVIAAFERAAAVWTARIKSPVTISMNIEYGPKRADGETFPSGVLGSTGSGSISDYYPSVRAKLIGSSSDATESGIYNSLPASVIPTDTGDGSVIAISRSLSQTLGFLSPEPNTVVATISFNKNFAFDFNPDNGIDFGKMDFVGVAAHEIGHALGFTSNSGEGSSAQVALLDMFRFRPGTTSSTFASALRIMSIGGSQVYYTGQTFVVGGVGASELGLSTGGADPDPGDGDGWQSSHWKADEITGQYIGIMDPSIGSGVAQSTTENDFMALETIGWNLVNNSPPSTPPPPPANDNFANAQAISGCSGSVTGTNLNASRETGELPHVSGGGSRSVWYQWQAPSTGSVTITTAGSGYDTVLAVYTGTSYPLGSPVASNDDIPDVPGQPHNVSSSVTFPANAGTVYRIAVDGFNNGGSGGDMGPIKLNWTQTNCNAQAQYSVTGQVKDNGNNPVSGAVITFEIDTQGTPSTRTTQTDSSGNYSSGDLGGCNNRVIVRPSKTGQSFTPLAISFVSTGCLTGSATANFTAAPGYTVSEVAGSLQVSVTRTDTTGAATVNYSTSDTAGLASCTLVNGKASERCDYATSVGTLQFAAGEVIKSFTIPVIDDVRVEGNETFTVNLSDALGTTIGAPLAAPVTILDNDTTPATQNPIDGVEFFIRQQYLDFLGRQPDAGGFQNWVNTLAPCPNGGFGEPPTSNCDRLHVAAGFFQSDEFLNRGYWAFRFYMVSYNQRPTYAQFIPDMAQVGGPKSPAEEEASKVAFADSFVQRPEFLAKYPGLSGQPLANALLQTAGLPGNTFTVSGGMTNGQILRGIAETSAALNKFLTEGNVSIQYFGFLRRDPDAIGYQNNVDTLNANPNNLRHMIFIFIYSTEYRSRFGP